MRLYKLIVNPTAGGGLTLKRLPEIEALLAARGVCYEIQYADSPEAATQLARSASAEDLEGVIAAGGDGTLFQIINGMVNASVPLLFAPCGTGDDFIKSLRLPKDPIEALKLQLDAPVNCIDVGKMNDLYFLNVSGTGFDVNVLRFAERYKRKYKGLLPYMFGLIQAVKTYLPTTAAISIDDQPEETARFAIVSIGNGRYFGGGMKAVPNALVNDGLFDVVLVKPVPKIAILPLIAFYITGKHVSLGLASVRRCRKLRIRCENMTLNLDGELRTADSAEYELLPSALKVRIPGI